MSFNTLYSHEAIDTMTRAWIVNMYWTKVSQDIIDSLTIHNVLITKKEFDINTEIIASEIKKLWIIPLWDFVFFLERVLSITNINYLRWLNDTIQKLQRSNSKESIDIINWLYAQANRYSQEVRKDPSMRLRCPFVTKIIKDTVKQYFWAEIEYPLPHNMYYIYNNAKSKENL